jgi:hypothetical protein
LDLLCSSHNQLDAPRNWQLASVQESDWQLGPLVQLTQSTEAQGFLQEGGDDCAQVVFRDGEEDEMEGTGIPWSIIGEAVGAEEQLEPRRSARVRELYEGEEFESEEEEYEDEDLCYNEDEI